MKACESNPNQFVHDCCEKARKFDEIKDGTLGFIRAFNWLDKNKSIFLSTPNTPEPETPQPRKDRNQKLRELIEKWIDRPECTYQTHKYLKSILEESKK